MRLVAALTALTLTPATAPAQADAPRWQPCGPDGQVCTTVQVPVDWARPGQGALTLRVAKLPATGERRGSVLYLPGGPGKDGIQQLEEARAVLAGLRRGFDVVTFETRYQKTMALPQPSCAASAPLLTEPRDRADFARQAAALKQLAVKCAADGGGLIARADSASAARDADAVRRLLGERRVGITAESYGGITATAYARLFPGRVSALHLDSTVDLTRPVRFGTAAEKMFDRFAAWCAANPSCRLHGQDVRAVWRELIARADADPFPGPGGARLTGFHLQMAATGFVVPGNWPAFAKAVAKARDGDASDFAMQSAGLSGMASRPKNRAAWCGDGFGLRTYRDYLRTREESLADSPSFGRAGTWLGLICSGWPYRPPNPPRPIPGDRLPAALGTASWTDYQATSSLAGRIPGSVTVRQDGPGHVLYVSGASPCVARHVENYFLRGELPAAGTLCPAVTVGDGGRGAATPQPRDGSPRG
ncbi:alpha/beta hydrolase [Nonomuraea sp. NPDC050328]|uniref:alpha/beta hydrolase n=1 Tax=Nonomuraea sp. NPDC050328 TaxID=3364361 RepID=UPI003798203C